MQEALYVHRGGPDHTRNHLVSLLRGCTTVSKSLSLSSLLLKLGDNP